MSDAENADNAIAIVGMACRFPGAPDTAAYWSNLASGVESIRQFTDEDLLRAGVPAAMLSRPEYVRAGAQVNHVDSFDRALFGYSPREAALLDPQQRIFLETAWHAMEHAGYDPVGHDEPVGVYAGAGLSTYLLFNLVGNPAVSEAETQLVMLGNDKDFLSTRAAYHLNLRGPSLTVQTGCSTSLVAIHVACDALLSFQCDAALAGGVSVVLPERTGYLHTNGGTASSDGHCRAFDATGDGTVFGSGAGVVVLKRLQDAIEHGDTIYATILGSAVNNDGSGRVGFTAPSVDGQAEVVVRAQGVADVEPRSVTYIEAHGTATKLGDPVEIAALTKAFRTGTSESGFCAIGSVKTNVGHLDAAAGVASIIKTTLALWHRQLPPSLNFDVPNPEIDFSDSPFYVNAELAEWPGDDGPRVAGVSAFGFGGTNAHVVLSEAPRQSVTAPSTRPQLLVLSARTATALEEATDGLIEHLRILDDRDFADLAYTMQVGRAGLEQRRAVACRDRAEAIDLLSRPDSRVRSRAARRGRRRVVFMFPGLGDHYESMGADLYHSEPVFRDAMDRCAEILRPLLGLDVRTVLCPPSAARPADGAFDLRTMLGDASASSPIHQTSVAHPALFVVEYALAQLWMSWGVRPDALIGHSLGEYVAATLAGVFRLEDALQLISSRARLIEATPEGAMLAVPLPAAELAERLDDRLTSALINGTRMTVVAGPTSDIDRLQQDLTEAAVDVRRLPVKRAFHSPMLAPVVAPVTDLIRTFDLGVPQIPFIANPTGDWITNEQATDPVYWGTHSASVVNFAGGLATLTAASDQVLLEVGPGQSLSSLATEFLADTTGDRAAERIVVSMRSAYDRRLDDATFARDALGQLWLAGVPLTWAAVHAGEPRRRVAAPLYPFERERAWIAPAGGTKVAVATTAPTTDIERWFWQPTWRSVPMPPECGADRWAPGESWLVLTGARGVGAALTEVLAARGQSVTTVEPADDYLRITPDRYQIRPDRVDDYRRLFADLASHGRAPGRIVHLWTAIDDPVVGTLETLGYHSLVNLAAAVPDDDQKIDLWVVTSGTVEVDRGDTVVPASALLLGAARCIPQETATLDVRCVDIAPSENPDRVAESLVDLFGDRPGDRLLAYRGRRRWIPAFEPVNLGLPRAHLPRAATFVITGGLGTIGLDIADYLTRELQARVVLVGRSQFPPTDRWESWLRRHGTHDATSRRIQRLQAMVAHGGQVMVAAADVTDPVAMRSVFEDTTQRFGPIHGVLHLAGVGGAAAFVPIADSDAVKADAVMRAKIRGADVLVELAARYKPAVVLLASSNAAILGGLGTSAYAAANIYLDALATQQAAGTATRWLSINLEQWLAEDDRGQSPVTSFTRYGVQPGDGVRALRRVLECAPAGQITLMTGDIEQRLDRWIRNPASARRDRATVRRPRPELQVTFTAPADDDERTVAGLWAEFLGISEIGRDDNFYELGGHSLLATQIVTRARSLFDADVTLLSLLGSPTVEGFTARLRETRASGADPEMAPIKPVPRGGALPLSYGQRRFWYFDQLAPDSSLYNIPDVVSIRGALRVDLLEAALHDVVARHEVLRSAFVMVDDEPHQEPRDDVELPLSVVDVSWLPVDQRDAAWREIAAAAAQQPFDLGRPPFIRASAVKLDDAAHLLLLTTHHSVSDGWSIGVFIRELSTAYAIRCGEKVEAPAPLPIQYADFAVWQRETLRGEVLDGLLDYWRGQLDGAPPLVDFPTDHHRPAQQSFRGAVTSFAIDSDLMRRVHEVGARRDCTPFMTLLAAYFCLFRRYSGQDDLVVGSPIAGRTRRELEGLVGTFVNMAPIRIRATPGMSFADVLAGVRDVTLGAYAHQDLPFELLVDALAPERSLSHGPIFQNVFVLQNAPLPPLTLGGLRMEVVPAPAEAAKFDLMFTLREVDGGAIGEIEYATDLFNPDTAARIAANYLTVLRELVDQPDRTIGELDGLDRAEHELLRRWGQAPPPVGRGEAIPRLLATAAAARSTAPALIDPADPAGTISFGELESRSNRLARLLRRRGIGKESRVGVHVARTPSALVVLVAIIKAGAAYVPLDPAYPATRLAFMATDSAVDLLVTDDVRGKLPGHLGVPVTTIAALTEDSVAESSDPVDHVVDGLDPAYVIYTSGSSGVPKGVSGLHRGMINRLHWMWQAFPFGPDEILCQKTSLNFLDSFAEIFGPLCQGVPVVVVPDAVLVEPATLVDLLAANRVTRIVLVPSLLRAMLETTPELADRLEGLHTWVTSGEALPIEVAAAFAVALPGRVLLNLYGSSELSADVTYHVVAPDDITRGVIPIGRPIHGCSVQVLDEQLRPMPIGAEGDLYVGGDALCRGYLGRPDLTADRFLPNPYSDTPGAVLYQTGDRARFGATGVLEYRHRRDMQVKVRGFRIELGEVEAVLCAHPDVAAAVVTADGETLTAHCTPASESSRMDPNGLRDFVRTRLPAFMVPAAYRQRSDFPLTPSGKLDRAALAGTTGNAYTARKTREPKTDVEHVVADIWTQTLDMSGPIDVDDSFFAVGGYSLLASRLVLRIRETFEVDYPLGTFFEGPTIAEVAAALTADPAIGPRVAARAGILRRVSALSDADVEQTLLELTTRQGGQQ